MNRYRFDEVEHIHLLDGKPLMGCSTVVGVIAKNLCYWAAGKTLEPLGWTHKTTKKADRITEAYKKLLEIRELSANDYIALLDSAYKNHSVKLKESAQKGIDLHYMLELFVRSKMTGCTPVSIDYLENEARIQPFVEWADKNVKRFLWSEAHCWSEGLWCGGISDVGAEMMDGSIALGDFKSSPKTYPSQFVQGGGYSLLIEENGLFDKDGNTIPSPTFLDIKKLFIVPFGAKVVVPEVRDAEPYKDGFKHARELFKLNKEG